MRIIKTVVIAVAGLIVSQFAVAAVTSNPGNPASLGATAGINVMLPITMVENYTLQFGNVLPAVSGDTTYEMSVQGVIGIDGNGQHISGGQRGQVTITGAPNSSVTLTSQITGCMSGNVQLTAIAPSTSSGNNLTHVANIRGSMKVKSAAAPGTYNCSYTLTAQYD